MEQTYYFPIFGFHLFCRFYRAYLASEFSSFLPILSVDGEALGICYILYKSAPRTRPHLGATRPQLGRQIAIYRTLQNVS